jgi:lysozyme
MRLGPKGAALVKSFETLELEAYPDPGSPLGRACAARGLPMRDYRKVDGWENLFGGPWTIGWGHTGKDVHPGLVWTEQQAEEAFIKDTDSALKGVNAVLTVKLSQEQFDAVASLVFNIGAGAFARSTILRLLNQRRFLEAAEQFPRWNKSQGQVLNGLVRRRAAERELFLSGTDQTGSS